MTMKLAGARKALSDLEKQRAALAAAEAAYDAAVEADENSVRVALRDELEKAHAAACTQLEDALAAIDTVVELVHETNAIDRGRFTTKPDGSRGRTVLIDMPKGFRGLGDAIRGALAPLEPVPAVSPTLLDKAVTELAQAIDKAGHSAIWQRPEWKGVNARVMDTGRTPAESERLLSDLRRMRASQVAARAPAEPERTEAEHLESC